MYALVSSRRVQPKRDPGSLWWSNWLPSCDDGSRWTPMFDAQCKSVQGSELDSRALGCQFRKNL